MSAGVTCGMGPDVCQSLHSWSDSVSESGAFPGIWCKSVRRGNDGNGRPRQWQSDPVAVEMVRV